MLNSLLNILLTSAAFMVNEYPPAPEGFVAQELVGSWTQPVGSLAVLDDTTLVWEKGGQVWVVDGNGVSASEPLIDLSPEVGNWRDHGLLGLITHPNFENNGWIFLYYVVDRHHLLYHGTSSYQASANQYFQATIARLTRYTVEFDSNGEIDGLDLGSRTILIGESITDGMPVVIESHTGGGMAFGQDGTLFLSTGDSANISDVDTGGPFSGGYVSQCLEDGILKAHEDVGALRSQLVDSLAGKLLRIDPVSGDGLSSNPYYDPESPRAPRSRVWAVGLRNPFRIMRVPETGAHDPGLGQPGTIVVADVGSTDTEELTYVDQPGQNLGWPFYEGMQFNQSYAEVDLVNPTTVNPLGDGETCAVGFPFRDLIQQDSQVKSRSFLNPCAVLQAENQIQSGWSFSSEHFGFLGTGALITSGSESATIRFQVQAVAGQTRFHLRYALDGSSSVNLQIAIDDGPAEHTLVLPPTGSRTEWRLASVLLPLEPGVRIIEVTGPATPIQLLVDCAVTTDPESTSLPVIPDSIPTFTHLRPRLDWNHSNDIDPQVATYDSFGAAATPVLGTPQSGVEGPDFAGRCVIVGPMMGYGEPGAIDESSSGRKPWPEAWKGLYFGDYGQGWVMWAGLNEDGSFRKLEKWVNNVGGLKQLVSLSTDRTASQLDAVTVDGHVYRYTWAPEFNQPPEIALVSSQVYGPSPHPVTFDASSTVDPEGSDVVYSWDFGDGTPPVSGAEATHVFESVDSGPQTFTVTLTAMDLEGESSTRQLLVSVNNTPPIVSILSPIPDSFYSISEPTFLDLKSFVMDAEHGPDELVCTWQARLHHNEHYHNEQLVYECQTEALVTPIGCGDEIYWYAFEFNVTDAHGLSSGMTVMVYPDCPSQGACISDVDEDGMVGPQDLSMLLAAWGTSALDLDGDGVVNGTDLSRLLSEWGSDCS